MADRRGVFTLSAIHAGMAVGKLTGGLSGAHSVPYLSSLEHTKANPRSSRLTMTKDCTKKCERAVRSCCRNEEVMFFGPRLGI